MVFSSCSQFTCLAILLIVCVRLASSVVHEHERHATVQHARGSGVSSEDFELRRQLEDLVVETNKLRALQTRSARARSTTGSSRRTPGSGSRSSSGTSTSIRFCMTKVRGVNRRVPCSLLGGSRCLSTVDGVISLYNTDVHGNMEEIMPEHLADAVDYENAVQEEKARILRRRGGGGGGARAPPPPAPRPPPPPAPRPPRLPDQHLPRDHPHPPGGILDHPHLPGLLLHSQFEYMEDD
jgi:hypothetical protein